MAKAKYEVIMVLVNAGFSEVVMNAARDEGVRGGTIIRARGTANKDMEKKYGIVITPDKEMIFMIVEGKIKDKVLSAVYKAAGLASDGNGIAFSIPVDDVVGMKFGDDEEE